MSERRIHGSLVLRGVAEFAIIVLGVLVAFQFESWSDARSDRGREAEQLAALRIDLSTNASRLRSTIAAQERVVAAADELLLQFGPDAPDLTADSVAALYPYAISWYAVETVSGAYEALLASGDIGLLTDSDLRRELAEFYGLVSAGFEDHLNEMDLLDQMIEQSADQMRSLIAPRGRVYREAPFVATGVDPDAARQLLSNQSFGGLLAWKIFVANSRLIRLEDLLTRVESMLALIEGGE
jgi:hypothetical protein